MRIQLASPRVRQDGDFTIYVNGASMKKGGAGFAVIQLDEDGDTDLTFSTPEEIDRLITAACEAKRVLLAARAPHSFRADSPYSRRCDECSVLEDHHLEPDGCEDEPDPAAVLAEAIKNGTPVIVTDDEPEPGHPYGNAIRAARAWAGHVMPEEPEPALEGTVTAPPQGAPYAEAVCGAVLPGPVGLITCGLKPGHDGDHIHATGGPRYRWPRQASEFADETATAGAR